MEIEPGQFVQVVGTREQVGKCLNVIRGRVQVEWFYSAAERRSTWYTFSQVRRAVPSRQTRCYWHNPETNCWETGRLYAILGGTAYINFPEADQRGVPEQDAYVRCHEGCTDPFALMHDRIWETPYFHRERAPLVLSLLEQKAVTHGLSALLSSKIQLFDHQIDVIRRVLEDPVQRYLLADEVGLGKTIEAGVIVRQTLLDNPNARVLIVVPSSLEEQWQQELAQKHGLFISNQGITFLTHDALEKRGMQQQNDADFFDVVVIDEAHHIARMAYDAKYIGAWQACLRFCKNSPRLLLLSATPALHHEADFLAMLHLLEPQTYSLNDLASFGERIRDREGVGIILDMVQEGQHSRRELREAVAALRQHLPEDSWIQEQAEVLEAATNQITDRNASFTSPLDETIRGIRLHICETHRVHRRMLRSSRRRIPTGLIVKRTTGSLTTEWTTDVRAQATQNALNIWREAAMQAGADTPRYLDLFRIWLSLSSTWVPVLRTALRCRLQGNPDTANKYRLVLGDETVDILLGLPLFDAETEVLTRWIGSLQRDPDACDQIDNLIEVLQHHRTGRRIIFSAYTPVAEEIVRRLQAVMQSRYVYAHLATSPVAERTALLGRFATESDSAILVCDQTGEEGLNLQFADRLLHFDLPWEPNRLEQRIGRVDRIGRRKNTAPSTHVFLPDTDDEDGFADAFFSLLKDGIGIFGESVADLQFFLEKAAQNWVHVAFTEGAAALREQVTVTKAALHEERRVLRNQAAVDELENFGADESKFADTLRVDDANTNEFRIALNGWMQGALHFDRKRNGGFVHTENTLLPLDRWNAIAAALPQGQHITFDRHEALSDPNAHLMRKGNRFFDCLASYMDWEDRGQAWAMWRQVSDLPLPQDQAFFRFDVLSEVNPLPLTEVTPDWDEAARQPLLRQASGWLPPECASLFIDAATVKPCPF